jgi:hypothetical protein
MLHHEGRTLAASPLKAGTAPYCVAAWRNSQFYTIPKSRTLSVKATLGSGLIYLENTGGQTRCSFPPGAAVRERRYDCLGLRPHGDAGRCEYLDST